MKDILKNLIKIAAVAAVFYFGAPLLAVLATGFVALKGVDVGSSLIRRYREARVGVSAEVDPEQAKRNAAVHRENSRKKFFDFENGQWDVRSFPLDMYPTVGIHDSGHCLFTCCGIENVVRGNVTRDLLGRQKAEFSMVIHDEKKAQDVADVIARSGLIGTRIVRRDETSFRLISDNAVDISTLVKQFYPPRSFEVAREVETKQQFVVSGCSSYEEALKELKENRHHYRPTNVVVTYQNIIDGHREPSCSSGADYAPDVLPLGTYVINETTKEYFSKHVTVNGGVDMTDEAMRSDAALAAKFGPEDKVEDRCSFHPEYGNALEGREPSRTITVNGEQMEVLRSRSEKLAGTGASLYIAFSSEKELLDVLSGDVSLRGRMVLIDTSMPDVGPNDYLLEIPADAQLLSSLHLRGDEVADISEQMQHLDISREDIERTLLCNEITKNGYVSAELKEHPDFSKALVGGVPADELRQRMQDLVEGGKAEELRSRKDVRKWMAEAALIRSVRMDIDLRSRELILTSTIQKEGEIQTKSESCKLTLKQMEDLCGRGEASQAELKDLVMRLHPDFFSMYQNRDGSARYADPIGDFIAGRRPQPVLAGENKQQGQEKAAVRAEEKKESRKKATSPKIA